jgi:hypothetical protein
LRVRPVFPGAGRANRPSWGFLGPLAAFAGFGEGMTPPGAERLSWGFLAAARARPDGVAPGFNPDKRQLRRPINGRLRLT